MAKAATRLASQAEAANTPSVKGDDLAGRLVQPSVPGGRETRVILAKVANTGGVPVAPFYASAVACELGALSTTGIS